jgi:hypothetical protein
LRMRTICWPETSGSELTRDVASYLRRTESSAIMLWKPQSPHITSVPLTVKPLDVGFRDFKTFEPRMPDSLVPRPSPWDAGNKGPYLEIYNSATIALDISTNEEEDITLPLNGGVRLHKDAASYPRRTES